MMIAAFLIENLKRIKILQKEGIITKKYIKWFGLSLLVFLVSIFLHECGHGIANSIAGIPCSTGFNKVGDIYKHPSDSDFRAYYSTTQAVLLDFGVPCTLLLCVLGTLLFKKNKNKLIQYIGAALATVNSLLRFVPCTCVLLTPVFTGKTHVEDEYETGQLLCQMTGNNFLLYIPALVSEAITLLCMIVILRDAKKKNVQHVALYTFVSFSVFCIGMVIAFIMDEHFRINWNAM